MASPKKVDIFLLLTKINNKDIEFFNTLTEEEQNAVYPFLLTRWMSGTYSKQQVMLLNEIVNPLSFTLYKHKKLLWLLLTVCSPGKEQRYSWNPIPSKKTGYNATSTMLSKVFECSIKQALSIIQTLVTDDIVDIAEQSGCQIDEIQKIRKELGISSSKKQQKHQTKEQPPTASNLDNAFEF